MESIYYVLCWHCHRRCKHCYEDRFHPYVRDELEAVVAEAERNAPRIIANLPESMLFIDRNAPVSSPDDEYPRKVGRIIISGGDVLTDPVRERVLYPTLEAIRDKYRSTGGVKVVVQTTGDLLTPEIIQELLARDVWSISVAGMDDYPHCSEMPPSWLLVRLWEDSVTGLRLVVNEGNVFRFHIIITIWMRRCICLL